MLPPRDRFRWLVSPRSTIIQISPVHTGRTSDPAAALERLAEMMVRQLSAQLLTECVLLGGSIPPGAGSSSR